MRGQDKEDAEGVDDPGEGVQEVDPARGVLGDEEVQQGDGARVAAEHVVAAGANLILIVITKNVNKKHLGCI